MKRLLPLFLLCLLFPFSSLAENASLLTYVIPSSETLIQGDKLRIDFMTEKTGRVIFTVTDETGAQAACFSVSKEKNVPSKYNWDGTSGGALLPDGTYTLFARHEYADESTTLSFSLTIRQRTSNDDIEIGDPLLFLPASTSDEDVWAAMQSPIFVADVAERAHQKIYLMPDKASGTAGKIHGQSQAVNVLAAPENGFVRVGFFRHEDGEYTEGYIPEDKLFSITPNEHYGLLIDKQAQTLTVYQDGKKLSVLPVTTGQMVSGDTERETRAGAFVTTDHLSAFSSHGKSYEYPIGYDGGNLIHSVGYEKINGVKDFSEELALLGTKDSHGCVRVSQTPNAEGIDIYWLYTHIPYHTKVLILDEPDARRQRMVEIGEKTAADYSLSYPADSLAASPSSEPSVSPSPSPSPSPIPLLSQTDYLALLPTDLTQIVVTAGGDCVLGSEETVRSSPYSFDSIIAQNGSAWPFSGLSDLFFSDDVTFVNLECVLKDSNSGKAAGRLYNFRGPAAFTEILTLGGIDLCNIANNHYIDYGASGKRETRAALSAAGIPYSGYGYTWIYEKDGVKIGFGGIRETIYKRNKLQIAKDIEALKSQGCAAVIYTCHFGKEYSRQHNELQTEMAYAAIDAGADIVIGHHPHVVQGIEVYKNRPIFYSVGNLVFGGNLSLTEFDALLLRLTLDFSGGEFQGTRVNLIPVLDTGSAPANDFRPVVASGSDKERILQKIQDDSALLITDETMCFPK